MEHIDLLKFHKNRHRKKKIAGAALAIIFLIAGSLFLSFKFFYEPKKINAEIGFLDSLSHLILSSERDLTGDKNIINILLLGIGGPGHDGPYLTDTMLIVSINKKDGKAAMVSIPRDLLVNTFRFGQKKVNHLYAYAEASKPGSGAAFTRDVLEELLQIPIHYYARVDFSGFEKIIDAVGGADIDVPHDFSDPLYPRLGNETQTTTVTFQKGMQHMDGQTALIYARSRHGNNGEGSDFARSKRQQQILLAVKDKILSSEVLMSPAKIKEILNFVKKNIDTDIDVWEAVRLAVICKNLNLSSDKITVHVLTSGPDGQLYATYYNSQYVLLPKKADFSDLRDIAANPFDATAKQYSGAYKNASAVSVMVLNGTNISGLATVFAGALYDLGYKVKDTGNAPERNFEKTVIYNISSEDKSDALQDLKSAFGANVAQTIPDWLKKMVSAEGGPDFVIVAGTSQPQET